MFDFRLVSRHLKGDQWHFIIKQSKTFQKYLLSDSEEEDDHIPEINEFPSWQMPDGPDDDDDDEDPEEQEEFINSDEFSSSLPIDSEQSGQSMFTKRSKR
jgi:hypothetical protein